MTRGTAAETLLGRLERRATQDPASEAFVFGSRAWSYGELWDGARRFAGRLLDLGLEPRARVVVAIPNGPDFFAAFYGALRAGAIAVPVFPGSGAGRLATIARRCGASVAIVSAPGVAAALPADCGLEVVETTGPSAGGWPGPLPVEGDLPRLDVEDVAYIQYTSGSTGEPKGVQITHANILTNMEQMIAGMEITASEVFLSWLPVHHDMGLVLMTMVPFYLGARLILLPASLTSVRPWLAKIAEHRATFTAAPDFAYRLCLRHATAADYDLSSLRVALDAAEPVRERTLDEFQSVFGLESAMVPGYGLAEATVGVSMWQPGVPAKIDARGFPAVGRGFPGVELAIRRDDGLLGPNEVGEILVRSPANTRGYWADRAATAELFWGEGFLRTGDLGYLDEEGDLFVVGREKNIIIQAGRNIAPGEVEGLIDAFPFVRRSAAVGIDRGGPEGEQIHAFVELRKAKLLPRAEYRRLTVEVTREVRNELGLGPGRVYLVPPRAIPLTHNGKIRHAELRRRYLDGSLRAEGLLLFPDY